MRTTTKSTNNYYYKYETNNNNNNNTICLPAVAAAAACWSWTVDRLARWGWDLARPPIEETNEARSTGPRRAQPVVISDSKYVYDIRCIFGKMGSNVQNDIRHIIKKKGNDFNSCLATLWKTDLSNELIGIFQMISRQIIEYRTCGEVV